MQWLKMCRQQKKTIIVIAVIALAVTALVLLADSSALDNSGIQELSQENLKRPDYNEATASLPINVYVEGVESPINIDLLIEPKKYTLEQTEEMFEAVYEDLKVLILGDNESLDKVSSDLKLVTSVQDYPLTLQWYSDNYDVIDYEGCVHNQGFEQEQYENVILTVVMEYMEYSCQYSIDVTVIPAQLTEKEQIELLISKAVSQAANSEGGDYVELPKHIAGKNITYELREQEDSVTTFLIFCVLAVAAVILGKKQDKKRQEDYRKRQLQYDYSEMVSKLTLLMGAGMTIRKAWERIVNDYRDVCERKGAHKRYVYEEMAESLNKLNAGISETVVYEDFGRNCNTKEYLKFSSLIVQNIKKGTNDLREMLELEAIEAFENRKNLARKYGEEAGTKLLFPMILMLGVVMAIIVIPAMMTF